jgi:hypothetical protein
MKYPTFRLSFYSLFFMLLGAMHPSLQAQGGIPLSLQFEQAVKNGTRNLDGTPGPGYFVNRADYRIEAELDAEERSIFAREQIDYQNNSSDTLYQLVIRMYQDLYKPFPGFERDDILEPEELTEGIVLEEISLQGTLLTEDETNRNIRRSGTNLYLQLREPLLPGAQLQLEIAWHFQIPDGHTVRMGTYGKNNYYIAYWYPQIAVYDDIWGWDQLDYTGLQEFYNDFGDFEVKITVPDNFLIWATGLLQNPEAVLADPILKRYELSKQADTVVHVVQKNDYKRGPVARPSETGKNTWHFKADFVPDFAFGACDNYIWDATSIDIGTGGRVLVDACYKSEAKDFKAVAGYAREIIKGFSEGMPGVPYPYPAMTIFNGEMGGGGMEYPMMVNDASVFIKSMAFGLTAHEIAHTYFPFLTGINERRYAWMDEGWASMLPYDLITEKGFSIMGPKMDVLTYGGYAGSPSEKPLMTESINLKGGAYGVNSYSKPATAYNILRDLMGDELFLKALHTYVDRWQGKHPLPYDFFHTFNEVAGEDLSWYWKPWFFETASPDLQLGELIVKGKNTRLKVLNPSGLPLPVVLTYELKKGQREVIQLRADVWKYGEREITVNKRFAQKVKAVKLGAGWIPDVNRKNNQAKP